MKTSLEVLLETHTTYAANVGGNYQSATLSLKKAMDNGSLHSDIEKLVKKHNQWSKDVGGNYRDLIKTLKKFVS